MSYGGPLKIRQPGGIRVKCTLDGWLTQDLDGNYAEPFGCPPCDCLIFNNWGRPSKITVSLSGFTPDIAGDGGSCVADCGFLNDYIPGFTGNPDNNLGKGPFDLSLVYSGPGQPNSSDGCPVPGQPSVYVPVQGVWTGWNNWYSGLAGATAYLGFNCAEALQVYPDSVCTPMAYQDVNNTGWSDAARFCTWQSDNILVADICTQGAQDLCRIGFTLAYDPNRPGWGICASLNIGAYAAAGQASQTTWYNWVFTNLGQDNPSGLNCNAGCAFPPPSLPAGEGGWATPAPSTIAGQVGCDNEIQANPCFDLATMIATKIALGKYYWYEWQSWYDPNGATDGWIKDVPRPLDFTVPLWPSSRCECLGGDAGRWQLFLCATCQQPPYLPTYNDSQQTVRGNAGAGCSGASKTAPPCCCGESGAGKPAPFWVCWKCGDTWCFGALDWSASNTWTLSTNAVCGPPSARTFIATTGQLQLSDGDWTFTWSNDTCNGSRTFTPDEVSTSPLCLKASDGSVNVNCDLGECTIASFCGCTYADGTAPSEYDLTGIVIEVTDPITGLSCCLDTSCTLTLNPFTGAFEYVGTLPACGGHGSPYYFRAILYGSCNVEIDVGNGVFLYGITAPGNLTGAPTCPGPAQDCFSMQLGLITGGSGGGCPDDSPCPCNVLGCLEITPLFPP